MARVVLSFEGKPMDWLQLFVPILILVILLMAGVRWYLRRAHEKATREFYERHPAETPFRMAPANFFGLSSQGMSQIRGNGSLFLTERQLVFRLLVPCRWIEIPVGGITRVENPRSFLGKTKGKRLLAVYFRHEGQDDSAAWLVADLNGWTQELRRIVVRDSRG
jgi:hypothetical protein